MVAARRQQMAKRIISRNEPRTKQKKLNWDVPKSATRWTDYLFFIFRPFSTKNFCPKAKQLAVYVRNFAEHNFFDPQDFPNPPKWPNFTKI